MLLLSTLAAQAQLKKIVFTPQWHANVQFAGYIAARELGYYEEEGLDVTIKYPVGTKTSIDMLREGHTDLILAFLMNAIEVKTNEGLEMEYNELLRLKYAGRDVSEKYVFRMCDHNYDIPEEGAYCLREYYQKNTKAVKAFIRASKKGWEWCRQHPEESVEMVTKEMNLEHIKNSKVFQTAGLKVVLKKQELTPGKISYT